MADTALIAGGPGVPDSALRGEFRLVAMLYRSAEGAMRRDATALADSAARVSNAFCLR